MKVRVVLKTATVNRLWQIGNDRWRQDALDTRPDEEIVELDSSILEECADLFGLDHNSLDHVLEMMIDAHNKYVPEPVEETCPEDKDEPEFERMGDDLKAAAGAVGRGVAEDEYRNALVAYGSCSTSILKQMLQDKEVVLVRHSGRRGIEIADEIDQLRMVIAVREKWGM